MTLTRKDLDAMKEYLTDNGSLGPQAAARLIAAYEAQETILVNYAEVLQRAEAAETRAAVLRKCLDWIGNGNEGITECADCARNTLTTLNSAAEKAEARIAAYECLQKTTQERVKELEADLPK